MPQAIMLTRWWERLLALLRPPVPVPVPCRVASRRVLTSTTWVAGLLVCLSALGWSATVATPVASPTGGTKVTTSQTVTLTCTTAGATIYYTTDGSTPTTASPNFGPSGLSFALTRTSTVKAIAVRAGWKNSRQRTVTYTLQVPTPIVTPTATSNTPLTAKVTAVAGTSFYYTTDGTVPTASSTPWTGDLPINQTTTLRVVGVRPGCTNSAVATATYTLQIGAISVAPAPGAYTGATSVTLSTITPGATITYDFGGTAMTGTSPVGPIALPGNCTLTALATRAGWTSSPIFTGVYTLTVPTPALVPAPGVFAGTPTVNATCSDPAAELRYTLDGSTPTATSPLLPVVVTTSQTVTVVAFRTGWTPSLPVSGLYTVNQPPVPGTITANGSEDTTILGQANAIDPDTTGLVWSLKTAPINGALATFDTATGAFTYIPDADWYGSDPIAFDVFDGLTTSTVSGFVVVQPVNDAPVAGAAATSTLEDAAVTLTPAPASDADPTDTLTWSVAVQPVPAQGSLGPINAGTGAVLFTPAANWNGTASFTLQVSDGQVPVAVPATVLVQPVNDAPVPAALSLSGLEDEALTATATATDADGDALTWSLATLPGKGTATVDPDSGLLTYTPNANANGADSLVLRVSDGPASATVTVPITLTAVNDAPVTADFALSCLKNQSVTAIATASDVDSPVLTWSKLTDPSKGTVSINATTGQLTYAAPGNPGTYTFVIQVSDGSLTDTATVTVEVLNSNTAPVPSPLALSGAEDTVLSDAALATDVDADTLTWSLNTAPPAAAGTAVVDLDGTVTFTPVANWNGSTSFIIQVTDGLLTAATTVSVTVTAVNDAPVPTVAAVTTLEDTAVVVSPAASDVDNASLTWSITANPGKGALSLLNTATGQVTYTPAANQNGADSFILTVTDGANPVQLTVPVTITAANDAPTAGPAVNASTPEDTAVAVTATASDLDGDALVWSVASAPASGSLGTVVGGTVTYTPAANANGPVSFTLRATDPSGLFASVPVTVTISPVNDAPVPAALSLSGAEDVTLSGTATATDVDGDALSWSLLTGPATGSAVVAANGAVTFTPVANWNGSTTFVIRVFDGTVYVSRTVNVTSTPVNDAPTAGPAVSATTLEDTPVAVTATASDIDGDALTWSVQTAPASGSLGAIAGGTVTYTPALNVTGPVGFTLRATDPSGLFADVPVTVTMTAVNDAPTAGPAVSATTLEDTPVAVTATASDLDGDALTWSVGSAPASGSLGAVVGGTVTYTPAANATGAVGFTLRATDPSGLFADVPVTVTMTAVNDAPTAGPVVNASTPEDTAVAVTATASDIDGDALTWSVQTAPASGSLGAVVGGTVTYTPALNANGPVSFTLRATDPSGLFADVAVTVDVTAVNDAPTAGPAVSATTLEDTPVAVTATASDLDGDALTWSVGSAPASGSLGAVVGGTVTYTPAANATGAVGFTLRATDPSGLFADVPVTVTMTAVNDAPTAGPAVNASTPEDTAVAVTATASDIDGDALTWSVSSAPASGALGAVAGGTVTFTPALNANGAVSFTLRATDPSGLFADVAVTVDVTPVNDAPTAGPAVNASTLEDTPVVVTATASDLDGDVLTWSVGSAPASGTLGAIVGGTVTYTPAANATGAVGFTLRATDPSGLFADVPVTVTVTPVYDAPVPVALSLSGAEDTVLSGTATATNVDGTPLTWSLLTAPATGTAVVAANGAVTFTPVANWSGSTSFVAQVTDGTTTLPLTVPVTVTAVNDAPVPAPLSLSGVEDTGPFTGTATATDIDGGALSWSLQTAPAPAVGTAVVAANGLVTFTPAANWSGSSTFVVRVFDGTVYAPLTVNVTASPVNDLPVLAATEGTLLWWRDGDAATAVTASTTVTDPDGGNLAGATVRFTANFQAGDALQFTNANGITGAWDALSGTLTLSGASSVANYQTALRAVRFVNGLALPGTAVRTVQMSVRDAVGSSNTVTRNLGVVTRSSAPWSEGFEFTAASSTDLHTLEMQGLTRWHAWDAAAAASAQLSAAQFRNGAQSVAIQGTGDLVHEYKGVNTGTWTYSAWQYIPVGWTGTSYFILLNTYKDNGAKNWSTQVAFNGNTNLVRSDFDGASAALIRGSWVEIKVVIDFTADTQTFSYNGVQLYQKSWRNGVSGGGVANFAAVDLYANGTAPVYYDDITLSNGTVPLVIPTLNGGGTAAFTEDQPPVVLQPSLNLDGFGLATLPSAEVRISGNYRSAEDSLAATPPAGITASWNGTTGILSLTGPASPADFQAALRSVTYNDSSDTPDVSPRQVSFTASSADGTSSPVLVTVTVAPANDAPVAAALSISGDEDTVLTGTASATDVDGGALSWSLVSGSANGTAAVTAGGAVSFTPTGDWNGSTSFVIAVSDGNGGSTQVNVAVTVNPVDDAGVVTVPGAQTAVVDGDILIAGIAVADADSPTITVSFSADAGSIMLPLAGGGATVTGDAATVAAALTQVVYRAPATAGSATITVTANGGSATIAVSYAVVTPNGVVPLAVGSWSGESNYIPRIVPTPSRTYEINVTQAGGYFLWIKGQAAASRTLTIAVNDVVQGSLSVTTAASWPPWQVLGGLDLAKIVGLSSGVHRLTISGTTSDVILETVMLVAQTPAPTVTAEHPVMVGPGATAIINMTAYDVTLEQSGWSWLPDGQGGVQLLPDLDYRRDAGTAAARGLSYMVYFTHPGTYQIWASGSGSGKNSSDSFWIGLDGAAPQDHLTFAAAPTRVWRSSSDTVLYGVYINVATAGLHRLDVRWREDGVRVHQLAVSGLPNWSAPAEGTVMPVSMRQGVSSPAADGSIVVEAEATAQILVGGDLASWMETTAVAGSVGSALILPDLRRGNLDPTKLDRAPGAVWYVRFAAAGTYDLWVRGAGPDYAGDSVHVGIAGDTSRSSDLWLKGVGPTLPLTWSNIRYPSGTSQFVVPSPGIYPIQVWRSKDGAVIDRFIIQPVGMPAPTGTGPAASPLVSPVSGSG